MVTPYSHTESFGAEERPRLRTDALRAGVFALIPTASQYLTAIHLWFCIDLFISFASIISTSIKISKFNFRI